MRLTGICNEFDMTPLGRPGYALAVELTSAGDEAVPVSGVLLARKGINAFPDFAQGFNLDPSAVIEGLPPDRYQVRVEMLVNHNGVVVYGDGKSELRLQPNNRMNFILPLPFQGLEYFINAPAEDLFIAATSLSGGEQIVVQDNLLAIIQ